MKLFKVYRTKILKVLFNFARLIQFMGWNKIRYMYNTFLASSVTYIRTDLSISYKTHIIDSSSLIFMKVNHLNSKYCPMSILSECFSCQSLTNYSPEKLDAIFLVINLGNLQTTFSFKLSSE